LVGSLEPLRFAHNTKRRCNFYSTRTKTLSLSAITIPIKGFRYSIRISHHESSLRKSLKRSKPSGNARGDALLFIIARITGQSEIIIEVENNKDITRPV
jgi:hypothetical protein